MDAGSADPSPLSMSDFDFHLPDRLIAQRPIEPRDLSRLLVLHRDSHQLEHRRFRDIGDYLDRGDLLVINDTRVMPARLHGQRPTGGTVELLLLRRLESGVWETMARPGRRLRPGTIVRLYDVDGQTTNYEAVVEGRRDEGLFAVRLPEQVEFQLARFGEMPLPPYIHERLDDAERYQTVFATREGSAAAPTAGLHFTSELLSSLQEDGVGVARLTLHVGIGTFLPVKVEDARQHRMHAEWYHAPAETVAAIQQARERGNRVVAVGTTSCRTLESLHLGDAEAGSRSGWTDLYITPGYRFETVDALVTNFHLPRSTLLLLVSALAGRERILDAYQEAIEREYRFFSFGDAMLII